MDLTPLSGDPLELLARPPKNEYALLELGLEWDGLIDAEAQLAAALRLFVITRDPLAWLPHRGSAWATANGDGDTLELPVYIAHPEVDRRLQATGGDLAAAIAPFAEAVLGAASRSQGVVFAGAFAQLAVRGEVPGLLERPIDAARIGTPAVRLRSAGWEPIGLGAIQDLVQDAFGPVDLDRSAVALAPTDVPQTGCPACAGERFAFPGDLAEAQATMCREHHARADAATNARIARARASNGPGWRAIGKGSARLHGLPDPPGNPLPPRRGTSPGRNDHCPCGSGRKYKQCCGRR